jgi:hypothetical protein
MTGKPAGLDLLRQPFLPHQISKLPKPTRAQTDAVKADFKKGVRCKVCGTWHHPDVVHLDYVGHAALTDRLLDCDPFWSWSPMAIGPDGLPAFDRIGGLWINLTVCGHTRPGYGHAEGKQGGDAIKEVIGDALRNAAMRFGAALDLWHKGDLHIEDDAAPEPKRDIASKALRDAWRDGVEDGLPENATPRQKAEAYAKAIAADFASVKKVDTLAGRWTRHIKIIENLEKRFPDLHGEVIDSYENRMMEIAPPKESEE